MAKIYSQLSYESMAYHNISKAVEYINKAIIDCSDASVADQLVVIRSSIREGLEKLENVIYRPGN